MKLSERGVRKIASHQYYFKPFCKLEFEPDDFQGAVVLTVDEATDIKYHLNNLTIISGLVEDHFRSKPIYKLLNLLRDRIEQAEKGDER